MFGRRWKPVNLAVVVFLVAALVMGCQQATPEIVSEGGAAAPEQEELEPVNLTWHLNGEAPPDIDKVQAALNDLPQLKAINTTVELVFYEWGSFDQKMQLMFAGGEECDLVFTASWANNYANNAVNGNLIVLDELIPEYAPKTWEIVSDVAWDMSRVSGEIYAIPNQQLWYEAWGLILPTRIAEKYDINLEEIDHYTDLDPYLAAVYEGEPDLHKKLIGEVGGMQHPLTWGYESVSGAGVIKLGDESRTVVNWHETPEYRQAVEMFYAWHEAGYSPDEPWTMDELNQARRVGEYPFKFHVAKPGVGAEETAMSGEPQIGKSFQVPVLSYVTPTMTGVCATSKNPERALMFFDLMYSDEEVYNLVAKGIEGTHWVWADKENKVIDFPEGVTADTSGWNLNRDWMIGNQFLAYYVNPDQVGAWEETERINNEASMPMDGPFVFDPSEVEAEMAALTAVNEQFGQTLQWGLVDPDDPDKGIDAYIAAQKDAGLDVVIAEVQRQLNAFIEENPDIFE